jgi:hypothetical protein
MKKQGKKLKLNKTTIRNMSAVELTGAAGGISVDPCTQSCAGGCNSVVVRCVDTDQASNCTCGTTLYSFQCATVIC